ncbi:hypothetical protein MLD38_028089 [Melastoma candidum]|uniref:Uncharacterized protein n=1 Tax=Melastoma candidum TaxID=119954 RepID=A0ACB9N259_9MYRT|nr:hypothetical protein MLD38_028089 [Melastoma candidum]
MGDFLTGFLLPLILLAASLIDWNLICLIDLIAFLFLQFDASKSGYRCHGRHLLLWFILIYSFIVILFEITSFSLSAIYGRGIWYITSAWWGKLFGFQLIDTWKSTSSISFLLLELFVVVITVADIKWRRFCRDPLQSSCWGGFLSILQQLGSRLRIACCLLLPAIQLIAGISYPSWISLPYFIASCVGLVDWSLTSNFLGLFRWWRALQVYAGFNIVLLYAYQFPIEIPGSVWVTDFIGLYRITATTQWPKISSALALVCFYLVLSYVKCNLEEMEYILTANESSLTESLLPSRHSFFIRETRSGVRHTNVLLRRPVFRTFSINFFTYGFPVSLFALSYWSFHFESICAFGLLAYVGYILYAFPSLFRLHRLNGLLLVFILLWALGTYIFNVAFAFQGLELGKDMGIWEMVGLWHYPIPGFFLLAQFCLGVLVALGNLVNNSVFLSLSDEIVHHGNDSNEEDTGTRVLIVATIAWGLRKCSRAIMLILIFVIAMKPGFIHAAYVVFFLIYILSHEIGQKVRRSLILLCEAHFVLLYVLRIGLIRRKLEEMGSLNMEILSLLGLLDHDSSYDFMEIALLACFCSIHNHGFHMLFSFSAIVQHSPCTPVGFSILKAGLNKSVLLSVYASKSARSSPEHASSERRIASFLGAIGKKCLLIYRSSGTYIAFLTILFTVFLVTPNYISFGYIFLLLSWIIGRQLLESTRRHLWFPLKVYAVAVFIFIYSLSTFSLLKMWLATLFDLQFYLGFNTGRSLLQNAWQSLAIVIVMQLYCYERRQSKNFQSDDVMLLKNGKLGFVKRLLVWHSDKILYATVFYTSLSPVSLFGSLFLVGLVICSSLPKASRIPAKLFLVYAGILLMVEYLFQMWGSQAEMFPGQKHYYLARLLGLELLKSSFWGLESGFRGKVLVVAACTLQYNIFRWIEKVPSHMLSKEKWLEPCPLFVSAEDASTNQSTCNGENNPETDSCGFTPKHISVASKSHFLNLSQASNDGVHTRGSGGIGTKKYSFEYIWGSTQETQKWNKKRIFAMRQERFDTQKRILSVYLKFWTENMFNLFGLEINMLALLLASFALLNAISMLYIILLASCILLSRNITRRLWPMVVFIFATILLLEYLVLWKNTLYPTTKTPSEANLHCHDCWQSSILHLHYCESCWLGLVVDDSRMLISYFIVFMLASFKLRADRISSYSDLYSYHQVVQQQKNIFVWRDLSFDTKIMWTILDYLRLYCYCHLLDLVLASILIIGTLEYDVLHLGYLALAAVFFRMRLDILKKRNRIFKILRIYNFTVIILSLAYQSPFVGAFSCNKYDIVTYYFEVIGFHKYDYGFRITATSALVEIIIFILVSVQSYVFSSKEFEYVSRYLEAEQIDAIVREQEKRASWKTAQLQNIREGEEKKRQRNMQVEKMKSEMLNLQIQLQSSTAPVNCDDSTPKSDGLRRRRSNVSASGQEPGYFNGGEKILTKEENPVNDGAALQFNLHESPVDVAAGCQYTPVTADRREEFSHSEITEVEDDAVRSLSYDSDPKQEVKGPVKGNPIVSAVQLIGDGVSQVQSIGNQAVNNLVTLLNIKPEDSDINEYSTVDDEKYDQMESQGMGSAMINRSSSVQSDGSCDSASLQLGRILCHIWSQMQSNNDVVCYCCFVMVFLWNFSLLSMVYLAALFLYALCVSTGPTYIFWVIMLIYTEFYILLQYLYQIIIHHYAWTGNSELLHELGFPKQKMSSSFVVGTLPLFLVYLFTLIQSSITAKDGEWVSSIDFNTFRGNVVFRKQFHGYDNWNKRTKLALCTIISKVKMTARNFFYFWKSLIRGAESPPYFVQISMDVGMWPDDGIQPDRIESGVNQLLRMVHVERCRHTNPNICQFSSRVHVQRIEKSQESPNIALAVFEVIYASPPTDCTSAEWYRSLTPAGDVAREIQQAQSSGFVEDMGFPYTIVSVIGGGRREIDLYAYIFGADLTVFFLVATFYQSVIKNKSEFLDVYQLEDQFPKEFVFILMVIFFLIVVDRVIYLCSFAVGKVIFYLCSLFIFTYYVTEFAWRMRPSQQRAGVLALRAIYLAKAVSLALQAIQVRYGIPHQSTLYRQFLTSKVSKINYLGYRLYRVLPFLYELRCVLDWSCTTTSLTMYDWLKLEDIYASLYLVKCDAVLNRAKHKQGEKQTKVTKCCSGICLFFVLICVIWAPMLMYSSGNPTNIANPIKDASVLIDIKTRGGRLTLYQTTLCEKLQWDQLNMEIDHDPEVQSRFAKSLDRDKDMDIIFTWVLFRDRPKGKELVRYERFVDHLDLPRRSDVQRVLNGSSNSFRLRNVYPRYFRLTGSGDVRPLEQEGNAVSADLIFNHDKLQWWSFRDVNSSDVAGCGGLTGPMAIIVSEETPPQGILGDTLSKFSIWGLYITFVLAVGRFIRLQCSDLRMRIPYENLPSCDRLIAICEDIYAARAEGELGVEEVLYWTLVKIYRSPHILLEYTKPD